MARGLICLPELFRAQYFCQREDHALFDIAEPIPGPSTKALSEVVREHKLVVIASLFERRAPGLYHNTAAVLDYAGDAAKDNVVAIYRKMHIPDDPLYYEKFYFTPGDLGFQAQRTSGGADRHAGVLGPVVSGGRARDRAEGRGDAVLPYRDRLASEREGGVRRASVRRVADDSARACDRERRVRVLGESRGT